MEIPDEQNGGIEEVEVVPQDLQSTSLLTFILYVNDCYSSLTCVCWFY